MKVLMIISVFYFHSLSVSTQEFATKNNCTASAPAITKAIQDRIGSFDWNQNIKIDCVEVWP